MEEKKRSDAQIIIEESGMRFGPFDCEKLFPIEQSELYKKALKSQGVAVTEFVLLKKEKLWFVEAKSATPNYAACASSEEKRRKYEEYIASIVTKFRDSIDIYMSILMKRVVCEQMPHTMAEADQSVLPIVFVLVIKNAYPDSLRHFNEKFQKVLTPVMRVWNVQNFAVISEEQAKKKGLVVSE